MELSFVNRYNSKYNQYLPILKKLTNKTFNKLNIKSNYLVELIFVKDAEIKKLNNQCRNIDKPTDVLSFAFLELIKNEVRIKSNDLQILGEIFISIDRIKAQAKEFKHSFLYELAYLYIHGLLHLLGYDHVHNKKDAKIMFDLEDEILKGEEL